MIGFTDFVNLNAMNAYFAQTAHRIINIETYIPPGGGVMVYRVWSRS